MQFLVKAIILNNQIQYQEHELYNLSLREFAILTQQLSSSLYHYN